ncbi:putative branched-chain-amino-acid aminotransferase [Caloramator mitchellensis]|uniref:Putative branched-chain-amino-acid aminotransferase n=1 Tax=Caloramator mitchellensis TaxID=908809 RepID=A0A0R3JWH9_CALMK|nr:aminotransferase class IV [Caloramator mitchellensis]KRQ87915.1 putative branched-chain-amino-acid aminotransferase [Caloramator mitchellensis]
MSKIYFDNQISFGLLPFETVYFDEKGPHFLLEHYNRLRRAHKILKMEFDLKFEQFNNTILNEIYKVGREYGVLKVIYYNHNIYVQFREFNYAQKHIDKGIILHKSRSIKDSKNILNYLKTFNYGLNIIEDNRAKGRGYDSAIFLNEKGFVCETTYANIFFVKNGKIFTPHVSCGILKGIMRDNVIRKLKNNRYNVIKGFIKYEELNEFDECFISNSVMGILPVSRIGNISFNKRNVFEILSNEDIFMRKWIK